MAQPVFVIAEAGINHVGHLGVALEMVEVAASCGADAVKFQTFSAEKIATAEAALTDYQAVEVTTGMSQREMLQAYELDRSAHETLITRCRENGIMFMSTAFDSDSLRLLLEFDVSVLKVPSGEINNLPYLREIAAAGRPVLLSTGMADLDEVKAAVVTLEEGGLSRGLITVLHCTSNYPTQPDEVNITAMRTIASELKVAVGYSDHTLGREAAVAAVALGAVVIEKHFTLSRSLPGPDHQASLTPSELADYIRAIRDATAMIGDGLKRPVSSELATRNLVRKSIVAAVPIRKGETIRVEQLTTKRPGLGVSPMLWDEIVGSTATRDYALDEAIEP